MDRRKFIDTTCRICMLGIVSAVVLSEEACAPTSKIYSANSENGNVKIPLSKMNNEKSLLVKTDLVTEKILLVKKQDETYEAVLMKCTHKGVELEKKDEILVCNAHGSKFDLTGKVINSPAKQPLTVYKVVKEETQLVIQIRQ